MKGLNVLLASAFAAAFVFGCSQFSSSPTASNEGTKGEVQLLFNLNRVGSLAKSAAITLDSLTLDFSASGEAAVHRMVPISGSNQQVVNLTMELACKQWTVGVKTWDGARAWENVHSGSAVFTVVEGNNPPVSLTLDSRFSMLMTRINPVPDSATFIGLYQGNDRSNMMMIWDDTTFTRRTQLSTDTVKLYYDWLAVSMSGPMAQPQNIQVIIRGIWNGQQVDLYWGTLSIPSVVAGVDASYSFNLNWIGPSNVIGQQPITITIYKVATITADGTPITPTNP